jgi:uncharacterized protein
MPDFERAQQYVLRRLEDELAPHLVYHGTAHTRDDVVPAIERFAAVEGVTGDDLLLLRTAAWFHDIGFVERAVDNEIIAVRIANDMLPEWDYSKAQIATISGIILATRLPQTPHTPLEALMADADLDVLGRDDFLLKNGLLRRELAAGGIILSDVQWYTNQLRFIEQHQYFTETARCLRDAGKGRNIEAMRALLHRAEADAANAGG